MTATLNSHADRPVWRDTIDGRPAIAKRTDDTLGQAAVLDALSRSPFAPHVPRPLHHDDDTCWMSVVPGQPVGARGDVGRSVDLSRSVAEMLAGLHTSGVVVPRRRSPAKLVASLRRKVRTPDEAKVVETIAGRAAARDVCPAVINHGDFSPRNVLIDENGHLSLIDFDRVQMASPARDVAYWGAWLWVTGDHSWAAGDAFAHDYAAALVDVRPDLASHRACALVRIATSWSALADRPTERATILAEAAAQVA
jgi:Ser/Thr protein kinase RdoA (MazF antagonist)